ncbi:hypothetical protein GOP47_0006732 [Adiantum capillus-veneris]|uniref:Uncharacterized protein n=1 Tax=Adiantum capillus-veneris TaxID=13818 RepID=A0A9D4ZMS1_ADICA|nr:hypothetical protein GOP47_0006732 [Adiantum capillus-veneris]
MGFREWEAWILRRYWFPSSWLAPSELSPEMSLRLWMLLSSETICQVFFSALMSGYINVFSMESAGGSTPDYSFSAGGVMVFSRTIFSRTIFGLDTESLLLDLTLRLHLLNHDSR